MSFRFKRPVGAAADVKELEYIAALHQTSIDDMEKFEDASIEATDVMNYLLSRYGIKVTEDDVKTLIFHELACGDIKSDFIDLTRVVAMIIIPYLVKVSQFNAHTSRGDQFQLGVDANVDTDANGATAPISGYEKEAWKSFQRLRDGIDESIMDDVLDIILSDVNGYGNRHGNTDTRDTNTDTDTDTHMDPQPLTRGLLRRIFEVYGEDDLIDDDEALLDEMIEIATGGGQGGAGEEDEEEGESFVVLDSAAFVRGLTSDVKCYDALKETKFTTFYEDVFGHETASYQSGSLGCKKRRREDTGSTDPRNNIVEEDDNVERGQMRDDHEEKEKETNDVPRIFTFPQIDFLADTYQSKIHYNLAWMAAVVLYISVFLYIGENSLVAAQDICPADMIQSFRCQVGIQITAWLAIMVACFVIFAPCIMILSLGNNIYRRSLLEIVGAIIGVVLLVFLPFEFRGHIVKYVEMNHPLLIKVAGWAYLIIGALLLVMQAFNIIRFLVPVDKITKWRITSLILRGTGVKSEFGIKKAAAHKVHRMMQNAFDLHVVDGCEENRDSSKSRALLNYNKETEKRESIGGLRWIWKEYLRGTFLNREGIWIHTRLQTSNTVQMLLAIIMPAFLYYFSAVFVGIVFKPPDILPDKLPENRECVLIFDPHLCIFPDSIGSSEVPMGIGICQNVKLENTTCLENFYKADEFWGIFYCSLLNFTGGYNPNDGCSDFYFPLVPMYAQTEESVSNDYCAASISFCYPLGQEMTCVVGLTLVPDIGLDLIPFRFFEAGTGCTNYINYTSYEDTIDPFFNSSDVSDLIAHGEDLAYLLAQRREIDEAILERVTEWYAVYFPERWMLEYSFGIGLVTSFVVGVANSLYSIPSQIMTTLKYRTGAIASLRDPTFRTLRSNMLLTSSLLGATVWGSIFTSVAIFVFFFCNLFSWFRYVVGFIATIIGIFTTMIFKIIMSKVLNKHNFAGYYRRHPLLANIANLCFECWHLSVTSGYVAVRMFKLAVVAVVYISRFDRPILAEGVGQVGALRLDNFPNVFRMDLVATDAHRHPYIERLGMMYMMKLHHGSNFGCRAGSAWRLLFVFALMPWLHKYQIERQLKEESERNMFNERSPSTLSMFEKSAVISTTKAQAKEKDGEIAMSENEMAIADQKRTALDAQTPKTIASNEDKNEYENLLCSGLRESVSSHENMSHALIR